MIDSIAQARHCNAVSDPPFIIDRTTAMGQEINKTVFSNDDFTEFQQRLSAETDILREMLEQQHFNDPSTSTGFELEGWLVDHNLFPAPINQPILNQLNSPLVVPELSRFNIELNGTPQQLTGNALQNLQQELEQTLQQCQAAAHDHQSALLMIGTLPTLRNSDLCMANMSPTGRFLALNDQVLKARHQQPIRLAISGREQLVVTHHDVMLEAAATSFQVHLQTPPESFVSHFNASIMISAPLLAAAANSPFLFGKDLWAETRIPLFEQAITTVNAHQQTRVNFGEGFIEAHDDCFQYNHRHHPVLLPLLFEDAPDRLKHLRLHNGTVWRWNRPLIDFNRHGQPHFRIEQRVLPAGPSVVDMIANAALYLGATSTLAKLTDSPGYQLSFEQSRANFYQAARHGLDAELIWLDGKQHKINELLLEEILPMADQGLTELGIDASQRCYYLSVIRGRLESRQTGAQWQRDFIERHGRNFFQMTTEYLHRQQSGMPVHEWEI